MRYDEPRLFAGVCHECVYVCVFITSESVCFITERRFLNKYIKVFARIRAKKTDWKWNGDPESNRRRRRAPGAVLRVAPACLSAACAPARAQPAGWRTAAAPQQPVALVATPVGRCAWPGSAGGTYVFF